MPCVTRVFASVFLAACAAATVVAAEPPTQRQWLPATPEKLPRWRGFNLLEKFYLSDRRKPFLQQDFRLISKLGFNFVRLPMDYRCWIKDGNWERFDEATLEQIDQAVAWGAKYGIHVAINFHRAPAIRSPSRRREPVFGPTPGHSASVPGTGPCLPAATGASPASV